MKNNTTITTDQVLRVAGLAHIPITTAEADALTEAFVETLEKVELLKSIDTTNTEPTNQVTGLENVLREDIVKPEQSFTQQQALANAQHTHQGYFVVKRVIADK